LLAKTADFAGFSYEITTLITVWLQVRVLPGQFEDLASIKPSSNILREEQENGPELVKRVEEIAQDLGEDGVIDLVNTIKMVYADGNSKTCSLNEDVASRIELFQVEGRLRTPKDNFFEIETEGRSAFELINLTHVAVIEVALERYLRLGR
jgi:hypothetical protein